MNEKMQERIASVRERIEAAAKKSGRRPEEITLIAVSKTVEPPAVWDALQCGITDLGENRVQELCRKREAISEPGIRWHLIGHLQTNKIRQALPRADLIHSVDSLHLLDALELEAVRQDRNVNFLLQVNVSGEESKFGIAPSQVMNFVEMAENKAKVKLCGLMTVPPPAASPEENKPYFEALRNLAVDIQAKNYDNISMDILSMGMSGDFTAAIEEGATMVRVGTSIFGARLPFHPRVELK